MMKLVLEWIQRQATALEAARAFGQAVSFLALETSSPGALCRVPGRGFAFVQPRD